MKWFSPTSLKALISEIKGSETQNMQAVKSTFNEVYENMEDLDMRVNALENRKDAAFLGNCYCGCAYLEKVSETDT